MEDMITKTAERLFGTLEQRGNSRPSNLERRTQALLEIKGLGGDLIAREIWGKLTGYLKRPLVETAFSFLKRLFGERFYSKKMETQKVAGIIKW